MSRNDLIKDTKRVLSGNLSSEEESQYFVTAGSEGCIPFSKDKIKYFSDEGCLAACEFLYDLNIRTAYSGANVDGKPNATDEAFVGIYYDYLDDENKKIADDMITSGIIGEMGTGLRNYHIISIRVSIKSDDTVGEVSDKLMELAKYFVWQDVLYGRTTEEEIRKQYYLKDNGMHFDYITLGEISPEELEDRIKEEIQTYYSDDEGNLFYTEDLLNKHIKYKNENKER